MRGYDDISDDIDLKAEKEAEWFAYTRILPGPGYGEGDVFADETTRRGTICLN